MRAKGMMGCLFLASMACVSTTQQQEPVRTATFEIEDSTVSVGDGILLYMVQFPRRDPLFRGDRERALALYEQAKYQFQMFVSTHDVVKVNTFRDSDGFLQAAEVYYRWEDEQ